MKKNILLLILGTIVVLFSNKAQAQSCNFLVGESVTFASSGATEGANQQFLLTDTAGVIRYTSANFPITGVAAGQYKAYSLVYDNVGTAPTLTVGTNINNLGGTACSVLSVPLPLGVCACNATGSFSFQTENASSGANVTQTYVLTNKKFEIISTHNTSPIAVSASGIYNVFTVVHDNTQTPPTLTAGTHIEDIGGACVAKSAPLGFVNCAPDTFDLALIKTVQTPTDLVVYNNEYVTYKMTVYNQGNLTAFDVKIKDYAPSNLQFAMADNTAAAVGNANNWSADTTYTIPSIAAKDSAIIFIKLKVVITVLAKPETFINAAEITFASKTAGGTTNEVDIDSQADAIETNDASRGDNKIHNENGDEDDSDFAFVNYNGFFDPSGFLYCDVTGRLVTDGQITVQTPPNGVAYIIEDGTTGRFQFFTNNVAGVYTVSYAHPRGFTISTTCLQQAGSFDPTGLDGTAIDKDGVVNGSISLGTNTVVNGYLADLTCGNNPFFMAFNLALGDPEIFDNNIPIHCIMPDLSVTANVVDTCKNVGEQTSVRIVVKNDGVIAATNVVVTDSIPTSFCNIVATPSVGAFDTLTGRWTIPTIAIGDSVVLTYTATIKGIGGVIFVKAEITAMDDMDIDSDPNNQVWTEDDIDQDCMSVLIKLCAGQSFTAATGSNFTNIQWYKNGVAISGATSNTLNITQIGDYTITANEQTCPATGCCPIKVITGDCCKPMICLPVVVVRQ